MAYRLPLAFMPLEGAVAQEGAEAGGQADLPGSRVTRCGRLGDPRPRRCREKVKHVTLGPDFMSKAGDCPSRGVVGTKSVHSSTISRAIFCAGEGSRHEDTGAREDTKTRVGKLALQCGP